MYQPKIIYAPAAVIDYCNSLLIGLPKVWLPPSSLFSTLMSDLLLAILDSLTSHPS